MQSPTALLTLACCLPRAPLSLRRWSASSETSLPLFPFSLAPPPHTPPLPPPWALPPPCVPNPSATLSRQNGGVVLPANFAHAPPRVRDTSGSRARATVAARMAVASLSAAGSASLTRTFRVWRAPPRALAPTSVAAHDARPPSKSCC